MFQNCPKCNAIVANPVQCDRCQLVFATYAEMEELRGRIQSTKKREKVAKMKGPSLLVFPVAFLCAFVSANIFLKYILQYFSIWSHEFGHALMAWLSGIKATPLSFGVFGMTFHSDMERSIFVFISFFFLMVFVMVQARIHKAPFMGWVALGLLVLSIFFTWMRPNIKNQELIIFAGFGGEFVLSTLLVIAFFYEFPQKLRWDFFKWPALFIGFFILTSSTQNWLAAYKLHSLTPFGVNFSEDAVSGVPGDLFRLMDEFNWSIRKFFRVYLTLSAISWSVIVLHYLRFNFQWFMSNMKRP